MNKRELVSKLVTKLAEKQVEIAAAAEDARQLSIAAPGRNNSRYDSSKEEFGYVADGLNLRSMDIGRGTGDIQAAFLPDMPHSVVEGAFVRLHEGGTSYANYLILPYGGGETIETDEGDIDVITPSSPLGSAMMGKKAGEPFSLHIRGTKREYRVEEIR